MDAYLKTAEGLATVAIALYVAFIGHSQWVTAREKLRFNLYNRRFEVYASAINYMQTLTIWNPTPPEVMYERRKDFIRAMFESGFLFADDPRIEILLEDVNKRSFAIGSYHDSTRDPDGMVRPGDQQAIREYEANCKWITEAMSRLKQMLLPYLAYTLRSTRPRNRKQARKKTK